MSGPKVMDVVSRQEMIDRCKEAIAEMDHALSEWQRIMDRNMITAPADLARFQSTRKWLQSLLDDDQFYEVQSMAPALAEAVRRNIQHQLEARDDHSLRKPEEEVTQRHVEFLPDILTAPDDRAAFREAQMHREQRRQYSLECSAAAILARCREENLPIPEECQRVLDDAAAGRNSNAQDVQRAMSQAIVVLFSRQDTSESAKHSEVAKTLGATGADTRATEALTQAADSLMDPRLRRISSQLTELTALGDDECAEAFRMRLAKVADAEARGEMRQRGLLLDSLEVDIAPALRRSQHTCSLRRAIGIEAAASQATNDLEVCQQELTAAEEALARGDSDAARRHIEQAKTLRNERRKQRAAQSSRAAILEGLKELGYEVREGMATQWAQKKQLVVRHAAKPGVALELAGTLDGGRLQARMVALQGSSRDPHTDRQVEEQWCSELESLRKHVSSSGGEITIAKALAAGTAPLKVVADEQNEDERHDRHLRERRLE